MTDTWGPGKTLPPAVTDPVVVDGTKYRIRELVGNHAKCRTSFRVRADVDFERVEVNVDDLTWDRVAGVWRPKR